MSRSSRRGPWLPEEDGTLLQLVRSQGPNNWVRISLHMQHRSPKQCRERFHQNLKPSLNHEPISAQEGEVIEQLVREMGKRWAEIARRLGNRSDNAVKNWWNGSMNRRKRNTVQQGSGSKNVGTRTQPIPASLPPPPHRQPLYLHGQSTRETFSGHPPFHRHRLSGLDVSGQEHQYGIPPQTQAHHHLSPISHFDHPVTSLEAYSRAQGLPSPGGSILPRLQTWAAGPPEYQLPPLNRLEAPAHSPAATEVSQTSSHQPAPSLVSDNQSNCSISPKTVTSPRPGMPTSKVPSMEVWPELQRRNSTGNYPEDEIGVVPVRRQGDDLQMYRSAGYRDTPSDKISRPSILPRPLSLPGTNSQQYGPTSPGTGAHGEIASSPQQKDSRMTVSRLLD